MLNHTSIAKWPKEFTQFFYDARNGFTIRGFVNMVERLANSKKWRKLEDELTFKGDFMEVLSEIFFKEFFADPAVGVKEYLPFGKTGDCGVDATGVNVNGHNVVIQVKYRHDPNEMVTWGEMAKTGLYGVLNGLVDVSHDHVIYVFTTADDVTIICRNVLGRKLVLVNRKLIGHFVDNNKTFWNTAWLGIKAHIEHYAEKPIEEFLTPEK